MPALLLVGVGLGSYKDEYLVWSIGGWTYYQLSALFGIGNSMVSDIIHSWSVYIDKALSALFPCPTRSEMLRGFPARLLEAFGHTRVFMHMDGTEIYSETPSLKAAHTTWHSSDKSHLTFKFVVGCCGFGTTSASSIPDTHSLN
jgi:hypothetical protein